MYEIFENKLFLKETMKKVTWFVPLHLVTLYEQNFEKKKRLELVTSLFELQDMLTKIPFLVLPFESENCGQRREKTTTDWINRGKKHFSKFSKCFFLVKYEK